MSIITFKNYKNAIREHYEVIKTEWFSGLLHNPSPAQIRTICLAICDKEFSNKDEETFRLFFETNENETLKKSIDNCNIDKFRPIISFLRNETDTENSVRVEMAAIIIGFERRPYSKFSIISRVENERVEVIKEEKNEVVTSDDLSIIEKNKNSKKRFIFWILGLIGFFFFCYGLIEIVSPIKQCMIWKEDHYEKISCKSESVGMVYSIIKPFDVDEYKLRKIKVCDTTTFFKNGKSIVWYSKKDGNVTFFNRDGINPENNDELKQVTQHMIDKYVKSCD